jgi:hypothetical protein
MRGEFSIDTIQYITISDQNISTSVEPSSKVRCTFNPLWLVLIGDDARIPRFIGIKIQIIPEHEFIETIRAGRII